MKRRFDFRLARVLRVRGTLERVARAEWAEAEAQALAAEAEVVRLRRELLGARDELGGIQATAALEPREVLSAQLAVDSVIRRLAEQRELAAELRTQSDGLRAVWRERERERRSLERLEQRDALRHREELERGENSELDELASQRARRAAAQEQIHPGPQAPGPAEPMTEFGAPPPSDAVP